MNPPEVLYVVVALLVVTIVWSFYVNTVWGILGELAAGKIEESDNWKKLKAYWSGKGIGVGIRQKVMGYLYCYWEDVEDMQI